MGFDVRSGEYAGYDNHRISGQEEAEQESRLGEDDETHDRNAADANHLFDVGQRLQCCLYLNKPGVHTR